MTPKPTVTLQASRVVVAGNAQGEALVTRQPINFTAAMCQVPNMLPSKRDEVRDAHHELFGQHVGGKVLVFPSCIGSTHTGLVLLDLVAFGFGPSALIVQTADSLLVSGVVLAEVWYGRSIPILEVDDPALFERIATGAHIRIEGDQILVTPPQTTVASH